MKKRRGGNLLIALKISVGILVLTLELFVARPIFAEDIPLIDAHSQISNRQTADSVIQWMDAAGIAHAILSFREGDQSEVIQLAKQNPGRITPAIKIKGPAWQSGGTAFASQVDGQLNTGAFAALGEALIYHAAKGNWAPEYSVHFVDPQFQFVLSIARRFKWPLIIHIEFRAAPDETLMESLEDLLSRNPDVAFPLIHMGQLDAGTVGRLIADHPNVYFMTSRCNPITTEQSKQPWTNMFSGGDLKPEWRDLMVAHPDRFIFALDNVLPQDWGELYVRQAKPWRKAFSALPSNVAHMIGHQNAERLWRIHL